MSCLNVCTRSNIPPNIASSVAASNLVCKLVLNGQTVQPATRTRRTGVKRKQTANVSTDGSGASTSEGGSFLASSSDNSNVSFSTVKCSSPGERINQSMDGGESASGGLEESTDGASSSAASTNEGQNNSEDQEMANHVSPNNSTVSK